MKKFFWKRAANLLLAALLVLSAIPVTAFAEENSSGKLRDIAGECEITPPSSEGANGPEKMVDGRQDTMWINNGGNWPCTIEFALPAANTKSVKKVAIQFENHTNRSMDVTLQYALNNVTSDPVSVEGSQKTAVLSEGYEYVFQEAQSMSHLYVTLDSPLTDGAAGLFWPAIAEIQIFVDEGSQEVIELENLAVSRAMRLSMEESVDSSSAKGNVADNNFTTSAPLHTKNFNQIAQENGTLPFVEVELDTDQKIRQFVLAMKEDTSGAEYQYTIYGQSKWGTSYEEAASGSIKTASGQNKAEIEVSDPEYKYLKTVFTAKNDAAKGTIPHLAEFQAMAVKAAIVTPDESNIAWGSKDLHSNTSQSTISRVVDGNTKNTWTATQYPAYVDIGLGGEYSLSEIEVFTPSAGYSQYSLYYSNDSVNYTKLAEKTSTASCPESGEAYQANGVKASSVRILLEYHSENEKAVLNEVRIKGSRTGNQSKTAFIPPVSYEDSAYNVPVTEQDTINEVKGIINRNIGKEYEDWFTFEIGPEGKYDYYEIENGANGKIHITGNDGISLASGLNYYLKYYCNVSITQVGSQVQMPQKAAPVSQKIHKDCKVPVRYAYNYCTMSYSMPFWGEQEWRKELDWLALNGVNIVLDVTAQEEVWRQFLNELGYTHQEAKDYIAGPAYYAWAYMANLSGYGGPVHDSWFASRTELARKNQLIMRKLGMQPILQGYSGMVPVDIASKAKGEYALGSGDVIAQGSWCSFQRPYMLKTTTAAYQKYAELFYQCQKNVFGDVTDYYATDPFHEGGNTGGMNPADISSKVLDSMIKFDADSVWVIQAWQGNPSTALVNGLAGRKEHALVLDLYADKTPHWNDSNYSGGKEFQSTPWVYCMLNNFGGRMGLHGHMDNLVNGVADAANTAEKLAGIGITPEGSQNNPVLYDLLFETVWCDDADEPLEKINTEEWLKSYVTRRYGAESENAYQAMRILENTVYKASLNMLGQGAPESFINARPATSISAASTWGNAIISYDMQELERVAGLLLKDYDILKQSDGYLYDVADILKQILSNSSQGYHSKMVNALAEENLEEFTAASDKFLQLIDKVEEVLGTREEFLLGTWVEKAKALADGADDFSRDLYEFNAKALVTTWGAYPQAISGGLKDYSNRQWAGLTKDYYKVRWSMWIDYQKEVLAGNTPKAVNWFAFEWEWARSNKSYTTEASQDTDLKALSEDILKNYNSYDPAKSSQNDYPAEKTRIAEAGSEETSEDNNPASNVLDGNISTIWHTSWSKAEDKASYDKHYIIFELDEETELAGLRYLPRQEGGINGIITGYRIYVSTDNINYELAAEGTWAADSSWKIAAFDEAKRAKYVKFSTVSARSGETEHVFSSAAEIRLTVPPRLVEGIQVTSDKTALTIGETLLLKASVLPDDAQDKSLTWTSSDTTIATVNEKGLVTAKAEGTAVITAMANDGSGISGSISLTIRPVLVKSIQLSAPKTSLQVGETVQISSVVLPGDAKDKSLSFTSSNPAVVSVDANGLATAQAEGTATVTAAAKDGSNATAAITFTASKKPEGAQTPQPKPLPQKGTSVKIKTYQFRITASTASKKTVAITKFTDKKSTKITIPQSIKINGYSYQVTEIATNAFRNNKKLKQAVISKNIRKIGKNAFNGCKNLKQITIKSKVLNKIENNAFKGIKKNAKITVPKKQFKTYQQLLKKAKTAKNIKIVIK